MAKHLLPSSSPCKIAILKTVFLGEKQLKTLTDRLQCPVISRSSPALVTEADRVLMINEAGMLQLVETGKKKSGGIFIDFCSGAQAHRRQFGGGKQQAIAKATGVPDALKPLQVLDATAGLGSDAFVLATLGCHVTLLERSAVVFSLLEDGLNRAQEHPSVADIVERMSLYCTDAADFLHQSSVCWDVIYLDPMFPDKKKNAMPKKEMQCLQEIISMDVDADRLLPLALKKARYRVVVKRPKISACLNNTTPDYQLKGKSNRFDVYTLRSIKKPV